MGRKFIDVAVVKAYDADGIFICEDISPALNPSEFGCKLLDSAEFRSTHGIRCISYRLFDPRGIPVKKEWITYNLQGHEAPVYQRTDGTIIENPEWV
jgi:hypothetical protein